MGICFLKHLRRIWHLVSPFKLQSRKALCTLFNQVYFLLVVSAPEIKLFMQSFVEICLAPFSDDIVLPQCTDILSNGERRKSTDNSIADSVVVEIPLSGFRNLLTKIPRVCPETINDKYFSYFCDMNN